MKTENEQKSVVIDILTETKNIGLNLLMTKNPLIENQKLTFYLLGSFLDFNVEKVLKETSKEKEGIKDIDDYEEVNIINSFYDRNLCFQKKVEKYEPSTHVVKNQSEEEEELKNSNLQIGLNKDLIENFLKIFFSKKYNNFYKDIEIKSINILGMEIKIFIDISINMQGATLDLGKCISNNKENCLILKNLSLLVTKGIEKELKLDLYLMLDKINLSGIQLNDDGKKLKNNEVKLDNEGIKLDKKGKVFLTIDKIETNKENDGFWLTNKLLDTVIDNFKNYFPTMIPFDPIKLPMGVNLQHKTFEYYVDIESETYETEPYEIEMKILEKKKNEETDKYSEIEYDIYLFAMLEMNDNESESPERNLDSTEKGNTELSNLSILI